MLVYNIHMNICALDGCESPTKGKFCSTAHANAGRSRVRKCADGVSRCSKAECECQSRLRKCCIICGDTLGRYGIKYCNNAVCKARGQHGTLEQIESWLSGKIDASVPAGDTRVNLAFWARNYLLEEADWKCTKCGWNEVHPLTGKPPLEIDHIDGNRLNNTRENLVVLCPNCHALTPTYRRHNYKRVQELKKNEWLND